MKIREGDIVVVSISGTHSYLQFIMNAFYNVLISGVKVQLPDTPWGDEARTVLFCTIAAPGVDRFLDYVEKSGGEILFPR